MRMLSKNPSGQVEALTGASSTPSPSRRIETSLPSNRSSFGIVTDCERPLVNNVVFIIGLYLNGCRQATDIVQNQARGGAVNRIAMGREMVEPDLVV